MKLIDWRAREGLSLEAFGRLINRSYVTVMRLERGDHVPAPDVMKAIYDATNGEVTLHDWLSADATPKPQKTDDESEGQGATVS